MDFIITPCLVKVNSICPDFNPYFVPNLIKYFLICYILTIKSILFYAIYTYIIENKKVELFFKRGLWLYFIPILCTIFEVDFSGKKLYDRGMKKETIELAKKAILGYILDRQLQPGDTLPPIRQLQAVLFISKNAALESVHELCVEGVLEKGSGSRNGFLIHSLPELGDPMPKNRKVIARFMLPYNSWNYVGNQFLIHVEREFSLQGGSLSLNNTENSTVIERQQLQSLLSADVPKPDILFLMASSSINNPNIELLRIIQQDIPIVLIDRTICGFPCFSISLDHHFVGADAVERLWNKGHRTFAFVSGFSVISPIQDRLAGYLNTLEEYGCPKEKQYVFLESGMDMGSYHRIHDQIDLLGDSLLELSPRPTGIVCGSDRIATCLVNHFLSKGVLVPEDIAIIGCDGDTDFSDFCKKPLCSYRQPYRAMSAFIYQTAVNTLAGNYSSFYHTEFLPEFIPGSTI